MKKIGMFTARGKTTENESESDNPKKIELFDGRFDTAYRVVEFYVWGADMSASGNIDVSGKLATSKNVSDVPTDFWNADDGREIAWAGSAGSLDTGFNAPMGAIIDPENLIVEDLYVFGRAPSDTAGINYMIVIEKYEISDWTGALTMAKDRAMGNSA